MQLSNDFNSLSDNLKEFRSQSYNIHKNKKVEINKMEEKEQKKIFEDRIAHLKAIKPLEEYNTNQVTELSSILLDIQFLIIDAPEEMASFFESFDCLKEIINIFLVTNNETIIGHCISFFDSYIDYSHHIEIFQNENLLRKIIGLLGFSDLDLLEKTQNLIINLLEIHNLFDLFSFEVWIEEILPAFSNKPLKSHLILALLFRFADDFREKFQSDLLIFEDIIGTILEFEKMPDCSVDPYEFDLRNYTLKNSLHSLNILLAYVKMERKAELTPFFTEDFLATLTGLLHELPSLVLKCFETLIQSGMNPQFFLTENMFLQYKILGSFVINATETFRFLNFLQNEKSISLPRKGVKDIIENVVKQYFDRCYSSQKKEILMFVCDAICIDHDISYIWPSFADNIIELFISDDNEIQYFIPSFYQILQNTSIFQNYFQENPEMIDEFLESLENIYGYFEGEDDVESLGIKKQILYIKNQIQSLEINL